MERKIKNTGFKVSENEKFLNPNTLEMQINHNKYSICPSKYYIFNNDNNILSTKKCFNNISKEDASKYMLYPYTVFNSNYLFKLYDIIDDLELFDKVQELTNYGNKFTTINRMVNSCIKYNFKIFKTNYKSLVKIYVYLIKVFYSENNINENDIKHFIEKWFNNNNDNNFNLNLGEEIIKNLLLNNNDNNK
jgi:hypothetical protein